MGQQHSEISDKIRKFIESQKIFFVATATKNSRINLSPKGMNSFKVVNKNRVLWLNVTGSSNETAAHVQTDNRMTVMFCAFEGPPLILRLYGKASVIHHNDPQWPKLLSGFDPLPGARQIFDLNVEMVQTSCGEAVPYYQYEGERNHLNEWAEKKGKQGIEQYWRNKNQTSIDGIPTHIVEKNL